MTDTYRIYDISSWPASPIELSTFGTVLADHFLVLMDAPTWQDLNPWEALMEFMEKNYPTFNVPKYDIHADPYLGPIFYD